MDYHIEAACGCNMGKIRANNEDNFYFDGKCLDVSNSALKNNLYMSANTDKLQCLAVFDGMGGESFGERASFIAAKTLHDCRKKYENKNLPQEEFLNIVCEKANDRICSESKKKASGRRMGTTAAILYILGNSIYACNVGDSRIYSFNGNELTQISLDHTDARTTKKAKCFSKPLLTQHLGIFKSEMLIKPYIAENTCSRNSRYLICSDGLTDMVTDSEIKEILRSRLSAEAAARSLVELSLEKGGKDNVTVIVCDIKEGIVKKTVKGSLLGKGSLSGIKKWAAAACLLVLLILALAVVSSLRAPQKVSIIINNPDPIGIVAGEQIALDFTVTPENQKKYIVVSTGDETIAVYKDGEIKGIKPGQTNVVIKSLKDGSLKAVKIIKVFPNK